MKVQQYLRENGIEALRTDFGIKVKEYPTEGLLVLNYDQIDSPKSHPIVMECRGLILDIDYNVVSRSMDRFFNYGEVPESQAHLDMKKAQVFEKVDGSLIRIYNWKGTWYVATRGMAFAEATVNGFDLTFKDLVFKALGLKNEDDFQAKCNSYLSHDITYICEVTSAENRCVKAYSGYKLYYLCSRNNKTHEYAQENFYFLREFGMTSPRQYNFSSLEACVEASKHLKDLDEGYVVYQNGVPVCKIKSPAYCAVHLIRGEGLSPKRIAQLVLTGEQDEYLTYFPEDRDFIEPYALALEKLLAKAQFVWEVATLGVESKKEFAMKVKDYKFSGLLFTMWNNKDKSTRVEYSWKESKDSYKLDLLLQFANEELK